MRLYDIASEVLHILDDATGDGELPPGAEEQLDSLQLDFEAKADAVMCFAQQCQRDADGYKAEADRLLALAKSNERKSARLKNYLLATLRRLNQRQLATGRFVLTVQANSVPTVTLEPGWPVPAGYERVRTELDSRKVAEDWRAGRALPLGVTVEVQSHLRVR